MKPVNTLEWHSFSREIQAAIGIYTVQNGTSSLPLSETSTDGTRFVAPPAEWRCLYCTALQVKQKCQQCGAPKR